MTAILLTSNIDIFSREMAEIADADLVVQRDYLDSVLMQRFGLPLPLIRIAKAIFERLPLAEAKDFFAQFPEAVREDGRDLSKVHWSLLGETLRDFSPVDPRVQTVVDMVSAGMDIMASGQEWPEAAHIVGAAHGAVVAWDTADYASAYLAVVAFRAVRAAATATCAYAATDVDVAIDAAAAVSVRADAGGQYWLKQNERLLRLVAAA